MMVELSRSFFFDQVETPTVYLHAIVSLLFSSSMDLHPILLLTTAMVGLTTAWKKPKSWCYAKFSECMTNSAEGTTTPWEPCNLRYSTFTCSLYSSANRSMYGRYLMNMLLGIIWSTFDLGKS